jgi:hypothetical protein
MAWLLGVALPLLATSMILCWLARRAPAGSSLGQRASRSVFLTAPSLFGLPLAFAVTVFAVCALLFVHDGLSRLFGL